MRAPSSLVALAGAVLVAASCSTPDDAKRVDPIGPDAKDFAAVADALQYRCGSLDCHGTMYRNLRMFGYGGLRLDASHTPETPGTQPAEVTATYDAIIGLEPEIMREVTLAKGAGSDRLTFVRKGRGDEDHKGGRRIVRGDDADKCVQSWLAGSVDGDACKRVRAQF